MHQLFKVKWPNFAWIEASLFFPVAVMMANQLITSSLAPDTEFRLVGLSGDSSFGIAQRILWWIVPVIVAAVPFLGLLVIVDRLLIIRRGFAILPLLATILWVAAALVLAARWAPWVPPDLANGLTRLSFRGVVTLTIIAASSCVHLKVFWIGLCDRGFAAGQLGVELKTSKRWRARLSQYQNEGASSPREVSASILSMRELLDEIKILLRKLTESVALQALTGCSAGVILLGCWVYYSYWERSDSAMTAQNGGETVTTRVFSTHDSEGSGERDVEGRYVFDVSVNNIRMLMRYDDDIPLVTIRAEDALRLGISFDHLDFATKIKTAKGLTDVAGITINTMSIGNITYHLVPGYVTRPGALDENILGHSFRGRLATYRVETNRLILVDRQGQSAILSSVRPTAQ